MKTSQVLLRAYSNDEGDSIGSIKQSITEDNEDPSVTYACLLFNSEAYGHMRISAFRHGFESLVELNESANEKEYHSVWTFAILSALMEEV